MDMGLNLKLFHVILVMTSIFKVTLAGWNTKNTLVIQNSFRSNANSLYVHCKSDGDGHDLGEHWLAAGQKLSWSFHLSFWSSTSYHCYVQWANKKKYFVAFNDSIYKCCDNNESLTWFVGNRALLALNQKKDGKNRFIIQLDWLDH
ncbi:hypothetical protein Dsin_014585 [Dipteronia sinensis]|uniref:S-protein homolog n=1 Tax=Dipteronia sinensis TaxID=43782 RepID=A0AAE0EBQ2_9ROSI|nr:hypothetical protein Dsin_014585 [Dipteronia sinensis]